MRNRKFYEIWLILVYTLMLALCVYLNFFSKGQGGSVTNLAVNLAMFVIVGIILLSCYLESFLPVSGIVKDLNRVIVKIEDDAKHTHRFLWEKYREEKDELFLDKRLRERFKDYRYELERILHSQESYYKCDIEEYINYDLIDTVIHRNRLNQVAGVMTGLGILGTFIGLSLGLQSFNTGSTAEITNSIEPLMQGIKVAFHTSIYGMVFSLVFNFVYKRILDNAERTVGDFLSVYKKYVLPDTATDGINRMMELEQQQIDAINRLTDSLEGMFRGGLRDILEPHFAHFDDTIDSFTNMATKNQMDQLAMVVNAFVSEMNRSLGDMFTRLSGTIEETLVLQNANAKQMEDIFNKNVTTADNINSVAAMTGEMADRLKLYGEKVQELQAAMSDTANILKKQREDDKQVMSEISGYILELEKYRRSLDASTATMDNSVKLQTRMIRQIKESSETLPKDVGQTFDMIGRSLRVAEGHFDETMQKMYELLSQMNGTLNYTYTGIEESFIRAAKSIEELAGFMQRLEEYYAGRQ